MGTSSIPSHVISLSVRCDPVADGRGASRWDFALHSWAAVWRHRRPGRPDSVVTADGTTAGEWWLFAARVATGRRKPWVVSPDAEAHFRALDGWGYSDSGLVGWGSLTAGPSLNKSLPAGEVSPERCTLVLSDRCTIIGHTIAPGRLLWVSVGNYLECDLTAFAAAVGVDYDGRQDIGPAGTTYQHDPAGASRVVDRYFLNIMGQYLHDGGGHWRTTAAQLSHQTWRRSHYTHPVLEHDDRAVAAAERESIYGGRAEAYFYGTIGDPPGALPGEMPGPSPASAAVEPGPVYTLDIRSQYPALLRDRVFPIAFRGWEKAVTVRQLAALVATAGVIAKVEIETGDADYPVKLGGDVTATGGEGGDRRRDVGRKARRRTLYPTGRFWTWLAGPELAHALARGRVIRVGPVARYAVDHCFRSYARSLIARRDIARGAGDPCREGLLKLLANAFAGKFAARPGGWRTVENVPYGEPWDEWTEIPLDDSPPISYRVLSGVVQRYDRDDGSPAGCPAVFAYLTSYGRIQLLEILRAAGPRGCVWCHTDGVTLTADGLARVRAAGLIGAGEAGRLRETGRVDRLRQWGPNHYFADGEYTLSGFTAGAWHDVHGTIYDWQRDTVSTLIAARGDATAARRVRASQLDTERPAGLIGPLGWHIAPTLRGDRLESATVVDDG